MSPNCTIPTPTVSVLTYESKLRHFEKIGMRHFPLIGRHLESVGRTEPVFELFSYP